MLGISWFYHRVREIPYPIDLSGAPATGLSVDEIDKLRIEDKH